MRCWRAIWVGSLALLPCLTANAEGLEEALRGARHRDPERAIAALREAGVKDAALEKALRSHNPSAAERVKAHLAMAKPEAVHDVSHANTRAREILADRAFSRMRPTPENTASPIFKIKKWLQGLMRKLGEWLAGRFGKPTGANLSGIGDVLYVVAVAAGVALVTLLALAVLRRIGRPKQRDRVAAEQERTEEEFIAAAEEEWVRRARGYASAGDWRWAIRCFYMASLVKLDDAGVIRYEKGVTNWGYVARVRSSGRHGLLPPLTSLTGRFDDVWYGDHEVSEAGFREAEAGYAAIAGGV